MSRPKSISIAPADADLTGFASNVTGATFTLTANDSGDGLAHQVSIRNDSATDHSGKTVTLVGTDVDGNALTEVVTAPGSSATVESSGYFLTLTSATPSATIGADTFDIGWVDEVTTQTVPLNFYSPYGATISVAVGGTIAYSIDETFQDVLATTSAGQSVTWIEKVSSASTTATSTLTVHARAVRVLVGSYSSGGTLSIDILQADL